MDVDAVDLWFSVEENLQRVRDAGVEGGVVPVHADARALPFRAESFDVIVSLDSFIYYGTDDLYLSYLARFLKPGGSLAIAGAGLVEELPDELPPHLASWWTPDMACVHSAGWWRRHWLRSGLVEVQTADTLPEGWTFWRDWIRMVAPENTLEIRAVEDDAGRYLGYVRVVARRRPDAVIDEPLTAITTEYRKAPLSRTETT